MGELIADYLRESLATLSVQARLFRDADRLKGANHADAAVRHGVRMDKAVRLLSALQPIDVGEPAAETG
jgi:hypothetical protein